MPDPDDLMKMAKRIMGKPDGAKSVRYVYIVEDGETPHDVSQSVYGDPSHKAMIVKANPMPDWTKLEPGTALRVPRPYGVPRHEVLKNKRVQVEEIDEEEAAKDLQDILKSIEELTDLPDWAGKVADKLDGDTLGELLEELTGDKDKANGLLELLKEITS